MALLYGSICFAVQSTDKKNSAIYVRLTSCCMSSVGGIP